MLDLTPCVPIVKLAREAGLIKLGHLGIDGTKVKANASKRKAMSYGRMKQREQELKQEIEQLSRRAEEQDAVEDKRYGKDARGDELPAELSRREQRLQAIRQAKQRLEERQREQDECEGRHVDDDGNTRGPGKRICRREFGVPKDKAQDNFTDPQSRIMKTTHGFDQCYNAQAAVDGGSQLIVATELTNRAVDMAGLVPMVEATRRNTGALPDVTLADAGYASEANFRALEALGATAYIPQAREGGKPRKIDPDKRPASQRMAERMATIEAHDHYRRRKFIPEPVFGWIKAAMGFRHFSVRGLASASGEWQLVCLASNLCVFHSMPAPISSACRPLIPDHAGPLSRRCRPG